MSEVYSTSLSIEQDHPSRRLDDETLREVIRHVLDAEGATLLHLSVVLSDHDTVRRLNRSYLEHDYNTDVLSFSLRDGPDPAGLDADANAVEGEIYVDLDTAAERHADFDTSFAHEAYRYVIHGVLHLVGYDDATTSAQETMREKEDQYLEAIDAVSGP